MTLKKTTLLIVDDESGVRDMLHNHFELRGFDVHTASDGTEAIEICGRVKPQIIMLDLKMKQMDGDKAIPELRKIVPAARIIVVSAYQDEIMQKRIGGLSVDAYFEKPVSVLDLEKTIKSFVR